VPALKQASAAGVDISSWDADVEASARKFFMSQPTPQALSKTLVEQMMSSVPPNAKILVMTSTLTAPNQNLWLKAIKQYVAQKYPKLVIQKVLPGEADTSKSFNVAKAWLQAHPETQGVLTVDGSELAGAAQAVEALGKKGKVTLTGIGVPSQNGKDIKAGTVKSAVLWNPVDIGYATMYMVHGLLTGTLKPGATELDAGRLGKLQIQGSRIVLGSPLVFTKKNIDEFKF
jgi:ABC-type sugar transport system substrate-binding protein